MKITKFAISVLLILYSMSLFSQTNDTIPKNDISLEEIVISVHNAEESKKTVAQQVQVLNSIQINNLQARTTGELISKAGLQVQMSQLGGGSPTIRGFEANRILLVVDGVRMNNLIYRGGHLQDIVKTDNNSLERLEILYGPASTVYGSDALGGVIHLVTKKVNLSTEEKNPNVKLNVFSRYGSSGNETTNHIDFNYGAKKIGSFTSFTYSKFGDLMSGKNQNPFYTGSYGTRPYYVERINGKDSLVKNNDKYLQVGSGYSQYDLMQKVLFKQNEHISHSLNFQYSGSSDVPRFDRLTDPSEAGLKSAEWYYGPQKRLLTAYDMNIVNTEGVFQNIHFGMNYQTIEESRFNRNFGSDFRNGRVENVGVAGANLDFKKSFFRNKIRFGADMQLNTLKSTAERVNIVDNTREKLDTRYPDGNNTMNNFSGYLSHSFTITDKLILTDGIRAGYSILHSTLVDTAVLFHLPYTEISQKSPVYSGSIGLVHSPSDDLKLSALVSTGYRVPNVDDLSKIFGSAPGMVIVPNTNLKPEKTINYELGITKIFSGTTRWENSVYYTTLIDLAVVDTYKFNGKDSIMYDGTMSKVFANQNKEQAYLYGFSSNLISEPDEHFTMTLGLDYTYGRLKTDSVDYPLDHIPPFMARSSISYTNKKFMSELFVNFNAAKKIKDYYLNGEDNEQYATEIGMPAWFTVNIRASYKVAKYFSVSSGIDNVFDTQYRTFASGINAPGRNIFISLKGTF